MALYNSKKLSKHRITKKKAKKQKAKGVGGSDLEEFMALEKIAEQEKQLKEIMIYAGRPGLWADWQRFQAEARKSRRYAEKMAKKQREELLELIGYIAGGLVFIAGVGFIIYFAAKWAGKI